jgi:leucyl-tRNA synthetase
MEYKEALKRGLYDFEIARNWYRLVTSPDNGGTGPHVDLIFAWIRSNALLIAPFTPHFSEHIWRNILGETTSVQSASFPKPSAPVDAVRLQQIEYMRGVVDNMRSAEAVLAKRKGKSKVVTNFDSTKPKSARVYVATEFPDWQNQCVDLVKAAWNEQDGTIDEAKLRKELDNAGLSKDKKAMPFCQAFKVRSHACLWA